MADIRHAIQVSASPETVYALVATVAGLAQWWASDATEIRGEMELGFFNQETLYRLKAIVEVPPSRLEWLCETGQEWSGTRLLFHLEAAGSGTLVRFTHADWQSETDYLVCCTTVWGELMFRLKAAAEGKPRGPLFLRGTLSY
jgi:uncharacterized protein YndB with AHSA1/START domain